MPAKLLADPAKVQQMAKDGMPTTKIAKELGITRQTVWRAMQKRLPPDPLERIVRINQMIQDLESQAIVYERSKRSKERRLMLESSELFKEIRDFWI